MDEINKITFSDEKEKRYLFFSVPGKIFKIINSLFDFYLVFTFWVNINGVLSGKVLVSDSGEASTGIVVLLGIFTLPIIFISYESICYLLFFKRLTIFEKVILMFNFITLFLFIFCIFLFT